MPLPIVSTASLLEDALQSNEAIEVPIGGVDFVSFTSGQTIRTLGTRRLNGNSALVLVSTKGAILANVPLPPCSMEEHNASLTQLWKKATAFLNLFNKNAGLFLGPDEKRYAMVYGPSARPKPFPKYNAIIDSILSNSLGVIEKPKIVSYSYEEGGLNQPDCGSVFIDGRGDIPKVYVEDKDQKWFEQELQRF